MSKELGASAAKFELTGGMGSGKSSAGRILESLGAKVFDTDMIGRELQEPGGPALAPMVEILGAEIIDDEGRLDRDRAGSLMFADPRLVSMIDEALHPMIWDATFEKVNKLCDSEVAVIEVPVPDPKHGSEMDGIVSVIAPKEKAVERLVKGERKIPRQVAIERINAQISNEEREAMSDFIIVNDGTLEGLEAGSLRAWEWMLDRIR